MSEPTLESIEDYNSLKGDKKKVVWAVVIAGLVMGVIYVIVSGIYGQEESISVDKAYKTVPMR